MGLSDWISCTCPHQTGAYSNDCKNLTQSDFVTGNATLDVDSMVLGAGSITGNRFCHPMAPTRQGLAIVHDSTLRKHFVWDPLGTISE